MIDMLRSMEDVVQLNLFNPGAIDIESLSWHQYNPAIDRPNNRFGCSITSLDGGDSGTPDLFSLKQYNESQGTQYTEMSFCKPTIWARPFDHLLKRIEIGRSHYLQLRHGGFFPWHRDPDLDTFRLIYTIQNCSNKHLLWALDDRILDLQDKKWYIINTKKKHCVFSTDISTFAVFNVRDTSDNIKTLYNYFDIK